MCYKLAVEICDHLSLKNLQIKKTDECQAKLLKIAHKWQRWTGRTCVRSHAWSWCRSELQAGFLKHNNKQIHEVHECKQHQGMLQSCVMLQCNMWLNIQLLTPGCHVHNRLHDIVVYCISCSAVNEQQESHPTTCPVQAGSADVQGTAWTGNVVHRRPMSTSYICRQQTETPIRHSWQPCSLFCHTLLAPVHCCGRFHSRLEPTTGAHTSTGER